MFFHRAQSNPRVPHEQVVDDKARHLPYDSADFDFGKNTLSPQSWGELDYAGLRVHYHLNGPQYKDELIVFLGASYFRALAAGTRATGCRRAAWPSTPSAARARSFRTSRSSGS